ncbi:MAG: hypothetical protein ABSF64_30820 [Bryobacteraceae bacterium]
MAFLSFDLRHHANLGDVLLQFGLCFLNIHLQKLPDITKLPGHELADASDFSGNGIRLCGEKLPGDVVKLLLADVDVLDESRGRAAQGRSCRKVRKFLLKLLRTLTHSPNLVVQASKRRLQLALEFLNGIFDGFGPQHCVLEFGKKPLFQNIPTFL